MGEDGDGDGPMKGMKGGEGAGNRMGNEPRMDANRHEWEDGNGDETTKFTKGTKAGGRVRAGLRLAARWFGRTPPVANWVRTVVPRPNPRSFAAIPAPFSSRWA